MKTMDCSHNKRNYIGPSVERILLDNEISLELESTPPTFESSNISNASEYNKNDVFNDKA